MSPDECKKYYTALSKDFDDPNEIQRAIDLTDYQGLSLLQAQAIPELNRFFGGDEDGPWSEFLNKGLKSLRPGFYKLCELPYYNVGIFPNTFAATVLYFHPDNDKLIKYKANIGPMTNIHKKYLPLPETYDTPEKIPLLEEFENNKVKLGTKNDYYLKPKLVFFTKLFNSGKIFCVRESIFHPNFPDNPRPKKVTWSFIEF
ncbi:hypothetical protein [Mucilaginibacter sp.]|uniref:hypothetical protein n=1 Tax=Mucilaginibacter sp. TaxID=1882438 RepID=UPI0026057A49|nr:hypothetical protein [Mucilaginibacter sp.]MDB5127915.1 hypothetical protein [Mucilaginibacter sp.]